jgi:hypothetical protein
MPDNNNGSGSVGSASGASMSVSSPSPRLLGPAKISRRAPAFAHVLPRRKEERGTKGGWMVYVVCLLFITGVVVGGGLYKLDAVVRDP